MLTLRYARMGSSVAGSALGFAVAAVVGLAAPASGQIVIAASNTTFVDVSVTGTSVGAIGDDSEFDISAAALTAAGFTGNGLLAGGVPVRVGNNGAVIWNPSGAMEIGYCNANVNNTVNQSIAALSTAIAITDTVNGNGHSTVAGGSRQLIAVLWDDNVPATIAPVGSCKWQVSGGNLVIQWSNEYHFAALQAAGNITYEMIVYGGRTIASGQPLVEFVYNDTLYQANQYQNDGGSATIGYKNWTGLANANDVEYGLSGGSGNTTADPAFGGANMQPKVGGWAASSNGALPHSIVIKGAAPACPVDYDHNGQVEPADIALFVTTWFNDLTNGTHIADYDGNGLVEPADISLFVSQWAAALAAGHCP